MSREPALWQVIGHTPDARLHGWVLSCMGYVEYAPLPMRRLEVPFAGVPLIIGLGPSMLVAACVTVRSSPASTTRRP